jgi:integrase
LLEVFMVAQSPDPVPLKVGRKALAIAYPLNPPGKRHEVWSWRMRFKDPTTGVWRFRALGRHAVEDVSEALVMAYRGIDPAAIAEDGSHVKTVEDLVRAWFWAQEQRGPDGEMREDHQIAERTLKGYRTASRQVITAGGRIKLRTMGTAELTVLRDKLAETYAVRTVNLAMKCLRQAVLWGIERNVKVPPLNWRSLRLKPREYTNRHRTPTHAEVAAIYAALKRTGLRLALFIAWKTGGRIGEVCALTWADLYEDEDGAWVTLSGKTGERRFPLAAADLAEIRAAMPKYARETDRLFSGHLHKNGSGSLVAACEKRGMEPFTFHALRRLMTDTCQRRGVDVGTYSALMGHTAEEALRHYRQPTVDDLRGALLKIRRTVTGPGILAWLEKAGMTEEEAVERLEGATPALARGRARPDLRLVPGAGGG